MTGYRLLIACTIAALMMAGCAGSATVPEGAGGADTGGGSDSTSAGASTTPGSSGANIGITPEERRAAELMEQLVVYFDFDESVIRSDFNAMLAEHGRYLSSNPNAAVRLEGHADERGTREYNIGLGERRSQAVRRILLLQGAAATQMNTISYGEERPAVTGSDDESWTLNRRVELVYR